MQSQVDYLIKHVPLAREMRIALGDHNEKWIELLAPLAPNLNDKQTAFGGSLATLCTLSGWCITAALCQGAAQKFDIAVLESHIRYRLPVRSDPIVARAYFPDSLSKQKFILALNTKQRARLELKVDVSAGTKAAVQFNGQYYARLLESL